MLVKFRILSLNEQTRTMRVRYYSDELTEDDLAVSKTDGVIDWCSTEWDIIVPTPTPTGAAIKNYILNNAPREALTRVGEIKGDPSKGDLSAIEDVVGQEFSE